MVRHQTIGVDMAAEPLRRDTQAVEIKKIILPREKNRFAVVSALHDMMRLACDNKTGTAGHVSSCVAAKISHLFMVWSSYILGLFPILAQKSGDKPLRISVEFQFTPTPLILC
jgi:hypothetical protein